MVKRTRERKFHNRRLANTRSFSISGSEDLFDKYRWICDNNFIKSKVYDIRIQGSIKLVGSGTINRGAYYSYIIRELMMLFVKKYDKRTYDENKKEIGYAVVLDDKLMEKFIECLSVEKNKDISTHKKVESLIKNYIVQAEKKVVKQEVLVSPN